MTYASLAEDGAPSGPDRYFFPGLLAIATGNPPTDGNIAVLVR
tara:strand:+ start:496 stop:624 length:129 start_codon:yes stop_codon:yes gene_type:complete